MQGDFDLISIEIINYISYEYQLTRFLLFFPTVIQGIQFLK